MSRVELQSVYKKTADQLILQDIQGIPDGVEIEVSTSK